MSHQATDRPSGRTQSLADAALLLVALIWGSTFVMVKQAIEAYPVFPFLAIRFGIGGLALAVLCVATRARDLLRDQRLQDLWAARKRAQHVAGRHDQIGSLFARIGQRRVKAECIAVRVCENCDSHRSLAREQLHQVAAFDLRPRCV